VPSSICHAEPKPNDGNNILVIEDEVLVRLHVAAHLRHTGFRVFEAGNADEALRLLGQDTPFAAVVTDLKMPGSLDGLELCGWINRTQPQLKIIILTAYPDLGASVATECRYDALMQKPCDPDAIAGTLRDLLCPKE
jgi:DNA-binding NtrC family response regulator